MSLLALVNEITRLVQELPKKPIPAQLPIPLHMPAQRAPSPVIPAATPQKANQNLSMVSKIGSNISQVLKDTFLPTMFNPERSKQPSTHLPLLQQYRVPHLRAM